MLAGLVIQVLQLRTVGSFKGTTGQEKLNTVRFTSHLCVVFALRVGNNFNESQMNTNVEYLLYCLS